MGAPKKVETYKPEQLDSFFLTACATCEMQQSPQTASSVSRDSPYSVLAALISSWFSRTVSLMDPELASENCVALSMASRSALRSKETSVLCSFGNAPHVARKDACHTPLKYLTIARSGNDVFPLSCNGHFAHLCGNAQPLGRRTLLRMAGKVPTALKKL